MKIRTSAVFLLAAALALTPALAGVVYEIEVKDHQQSPARVETIQAAVEGRNLKMEIAPGQSGRRGEMVFRGDRREMLVIDHDDRSYHVIDQAAIDGIAGQLGALDKQMEEALKNVPEDQRAMVEQMMKRRMPQQAPARPAAELRRTGEKATHNGYPCVRYDVLRGGQKIRELWVTGWDNLDGGAGVVEAFEGMASFFQQLNDSLPDFGQGDAAADPAFAYMKEIGGFPVVTREFDDDGLLDKESTLRSARRSTLDPTEFEPPAGYRRREMFSQ